MKSTDRLTPITEALDEALSLDALERLDVQSEIKTLQAKTNLVEKDMVEFFKSLGVKDGLKQNATIKDLKDWKNVLYDRMDKEFFRS